MNIVTPFYQQYLNNPQHTALIQDDAQLSYSDLFHRINTMTAVIQQQRLSSGIIAIALDRGIDAAICIYAVLSAGAIYLPLDLKNPQQRLNYIINDAQIDFVIGNGAIPDWVDKAEQWLDIQQLASNPAINKHDPVSVQATQLAAILYTSGSSGTPKGVALSHQALANFSGWAHETFALNESDRVASLAPFYFDLSVFDLFTGLAAGACVIFMPARLSLAPSRLTSWLQQHAISIWYTVPSLLSFIALKGNLSQTPLPALKQLLFAGEVFPTPYLIKLAELLPATQLYNLYGPTETNVCCYWPVDKNQLQAAQAIPIGHAAANALLSIQPDNGELLVQSKNNFSGYWQQGKLQAIATSAYPTGDKVSRDAQGMYHYHGRLDRMLKCSGYRVEPAEIEQTILQLDTVLHCAVVGIKDSGSGQRPAALLVLANHVQLSEVLKPIRQKLPPYMQPVKYLLVDSLPCLNNGKTDYQAIHKLFMS